MITNEQKFCSRPKFNMHEHSILFTISELNGDCIRNQGIIYSRKKVELTPELTKTLGCKAIAKVPHGAFVYCENDELPTISQHPSPILIPSMPGRWFLLDELFTPKQVNHSGVGLIVCEPCPIMCRTRVVSAPVSSMGPIKGDSNDTVTSWKRHR